MSDYPPSNPPGPGVPTTGVPAPLPPGETPAYTGVSETVIVAGLIAWLLIAVGTLALYGRYMKRTNGRNER